MTLNNFIKEWDIKEKNYIISEFIKNDKDKYENVKICAIMFLYNKMKNKRDKTILYGEYNEIVFDVHFDNYENFSLEDIDIMLRYGIEFDKYINKFTLNTHF